jgi:hypothetical protein
VIRAVSSGRIRVAEGGFDEFAGDPGFEGHADEDFATGLGERLDGGVTRPEAAWVLTQ